MHRDGGAQFVGGHLGQPEMADLARSHQFGHGAHGLLDGYVAVAAVHVVQVDHVGLQSLQALVDALPHVRGIAASVELACGTVGGVADDAEFGCERDLVAAVGEQLGDQLLVVSAAVDVGGVDERHAEVHGPVQGGQRFGVVDLAVHRRQRHGAEADCTDRQFVAQLDCGRRVGIGHGRSQRVSAKLYSGRALLGLLPEYSFAQFECQRHQAQGDVAGGDAR